MGLFSRRLGCPTSTWAPETSAALTLKAPDLMFPQRQLFMYRLGDFLRDYFVFSLNPFTF